VAGACFILPASLIVSAIAWAYARFGQLPAVVGVFAGIAPVVLAIVGQALWNLGRAAVRDRLAAVVAAVALVASLLGADELAVLALAGAAVALLRARVRATALGLVPVAVTTPAASFGLLPLFLVFLKIGSVLFGSGYVLLAFLRADLVERLGWLTEAQLLDAVAVGQVTPGPLSTTATFIGWILGGPAGAVVATVGMFLPAFLLVAASGPLIPRLRASPIARHVLDGVNAASLGLMAAVTVQLARHAIVDVPSALLAVGAAVALLRFRVNATWLVAAGALAGLLR
jgi:chromate transporter